MAKHCSWRNHGMKTFVFVILVGLLVVSSLVATMTPRPTRGAGELMEGDVNGDGDVTLSDSTFIRQYLLGLRTLTPDQLKCADTNDDGKVSLSDSTHIRQWLLDPDGHLGILYKPLWQSPADAGRLPPDGFHRPILSITFDDGWVDTYTYTYALPALNNYGFKTTHYIITEHIDHDIDDFVKEAQIQGYAQSGHEIASHTVTHPYLTQVSASVLDYELSQSKERLESIPGVGTITNFATPYGLYNSTVITAIKKYYQSHRSIDDGYNTKANFDVYNVLTKVVFKTTTLSEVQSWIEAAKAGNYWLVLVYHRVGPNPDDWGTSPANFNAQLAMIASEGIAVLPVRDAIAEILPQLS